jgi:hypothetical protein
VKNYLMLLIEHVGGAKLSEIRRLLDLVEAVVFGRSSTWGGSREARRELDSSRVEEEHRDQGVGRIRQPPLRGFHVQRLAGDALDAVRLPLVNPRHPRCRDIDQPTQ